MPIVHEGNLGPTPGRFLIVASRFNQLVVDQLVAGSLEAFRRHGVADGSGEIIRVPGAFEIAQAMQRALRTGNFHGVVALGAVISGETDHYDHIAHAATNGISRVALDFGIPVAHGILTCKDTAQAMDRAGLKAGNKGYDAALVVLEMTNLFTRLLPTRPTT